MGRLTDHERDYTNPRNDRFSRESQRGTTLSGAGGAASRPPRWATWLLSRFSPTGLEDDYRFMDQAFGAMYRSEQRVGQIALLFAGLAIVIACLGLFGLATYMAERRTREIGIRKVMGASTFEIVRMLSGHFLKLVLLAIGLPYPVGYYSYYSMQGWLVNFAYQVDLAWWIFAVSGLVAIGITLLTVSYQTIKAALLNPVQSLRSE